MAIRLPLKRLPDLISVIWLGPVLELLLQLSGEAAIGWTETTEEQLVLALVNLLLQMLE